MIRKTHQAVRGPCPGAAVTRSQLELPKAPLDCTGEAAPKSPRALGGTTGTLGACVHILLSPPTFPDFLPEVSPFHFSTGMQQTAQSAEYRSSLPSSVSSPPTQRPASIPLRWTRDPHSVICVWPLGTEPPSSPREALQAHPLP